jgi:hypothetical protein
MMRATFETKESTSTRLPRLMSEICASKSERQKKLEEKIMDRRNFATRLSIFAAALLPAAVRGQQPRSNQPRITVPGNKEQPPAQTTIVDIHKPAYGEGGNKTEAGVYGVNFHGGDGVDGQTDSGNGVHGSAYNGYGVHGESQAGRGVYGSSVGMPKSLGGTLGTVAGIKDPLYAERECAGVLGDSPNAVGVMGTSKKYGVAGIGETAGVFGFSLQGNAVEGSSASDGIAGMFYGNVQITRSLTKASGSFKIDHPLAPDKKYLSHSFVESPDMMNVYNGNVTTDVNGDATIMLPAYFDALNRDCRYQLTVIGQFAQAIVASKTKDNRFTIKTDKPNVEVSWQVTGIRQDAWANAHRIQVEEDKPKKELGSYLHPELFGQPAEKNA